VLAPKLDGAIKRRREKKGAERGTSKLGGREGGSPGGRMKRERGDEAAVRLPLQEKENSERGREERRARGMLNDASAKQPK
jgi:hypothetical protein